MTEMDLSVTRSPRGGHQLGGVPAVQLIGRLRSRLGIRSSDLDERRSRSYVPRYEDRRGPGAWGGALLAGVVVSATVPLGWMC
jgi:hypothetical protein